MWSVVIFNYDIVVLEGAVSVTSSKFQRVLGLYSGSVIALYFSSLQRYYSCQHIHWQPRTGSGTAPETMKGTFLLWM